MTEIEPGSKHSLNYAITELAKRLGIGRNSLYAAIRRGEVPNIRLAGRIILPRPAIDAWLKSAGKSSGQS